MASSPVTLPREITWKRQNRNRDIIFNENKPYQLMMLGTAAAWGEKLQGAVNWKQAIDAWGIEMPKPGEGDPILIGRQ